MTAYVQYVGHLACWTLPHGAYYIGERGELSDAERVICVTTLFEISPASWAT